ncbi:MAG: carboxypeptidase regulatory-like domain-containing protein [Nanoarchaeota archaeon]|nr:carboxypeptidase regulatory-like domain-containing protein [Nanoarchaeota archaeon]
MMLKKRGFLVVLMLILLIFSSYSVFSEDVSGCYTYSKGSEDLYCIGGTLKSEATLDCAEFSGCDINQVFVPGSNCAELKECEEITCNVDCQIHARGVCTQKGGEEVPSEEYALWCSPGCCKISNKFCQFNLNKWQCQDKAQKLGLGTFDIFDNSLGMNTAKCNQLYCGGEVKKASLGGYVKDKDDKPLNIVKISLEGTGLSKNTEGSGKYDFIDLNPGTYLVKATKDGFMPQSFSISLLPGEKAVKNITLIEAVGAAKISGVVKDENNLAVKGATVSWKGPISGQVFTNDTGEYTLPGLPAGDYVFTASKVGFGPDEKKVTVGVKDMIMNFVLKEAAFQGIEGKAYLDSNNNNKLDSSDEAIYGVKIYVDNIFKGFSQYPNGNYQATVKVVDVNGESHQLSATYQDYKYGPEEVLISKEGSVYKEILLTKYIGECTFPNPVKDIAEYSVEHIKGKKEVKLIWKKPCPEVINYLISKYKDGNKIDDFTASPAESFKLRSDVEWGEEYSYEIVAVYDQGRISEKPAIVTVTLGDEECEGRFSETEGWDLFCSVEKDSRKTIWTCNNQNKLTVSKDCSENDGPGEVYFCAGVGKHNAVCKNAGVCGVEAQQADPFGLYFNKDSCYGSSLVEEEGAANYCYFDYTKSVVDSCNRCDEVVSCFDYKSKDACTINNCLGAKCDWIDGAESNPLLDYSLLFSGLDIPTLVTSETGAGYCVEEKYNDDDKCSLCGPNANLFENFFCTAEVCSGLGRCFSNSITKKSYLTYCEACGDKPTINTNCYTYSFESECNGGQDLEKNDQEEITLSTDRCGWGRCFWNGVSGGAGSCVKDGDGNLNDDCSIFANVGERNSCRKDNKAPHTVLLNVGTNVISLGKSNLTFKGVDEESPLGVIGYCLTSADSGSPGVCTDFTESPYAGKLKDETITVDLINSKYLQQNIPGKTYMLKFYSKDKFFNQENVQTTFVYVDNAPPQFEINEKIETKGDITTLNTYLDGTSEPMECSFVLKQIVPAGGEKKQVVERSKEKKEVVFENLAGVKFDLNVTCEDNFGNKNSKTKSYVFDLEEKIEIVYPKLNGAVASTTISFEINTLAGASCALYKTATNEKVADFITDEEGKMHKTPEVPGFFEGEYAGEYKAVCKELFTDDIFEDFFHFWVDFFPPSTQIVLQEGARIVKPVDTDWEEYFVKNVLINFECNPENLGGFECDRTLYCLGDGCDSINSPGYKEYTQTVVLDASSRICYYSTDLAKNPVYSPWCGDVKVEGYGITLEKPNLYYYLDEMWGVSNKPVFPWQFFTKVLTQTCKFDFLSGYDYYSLPQSKTIEINAEGKYLMEKFPEEVFSIYPEDGGVKDVYVSCENLEDELGPEQKIHLEYDPTAPKITSAQANPNKILEGITTNLLVSTDDKTICGYSDNSEKEGSIEFDMMTFYFPGFDEGVLNINHEDVFNINFFGAKKDYVLNVVCKNGAGDASELKEIGFTVDYSAFGNIINISPSGYTKETAITLIVETNKRAFCELKVNDSFTPFSQGINTNVNTAPLGTLKEGKYIIPIKCTMGDHVAEGKADFTIDLTPPKISEVADGNYSCGKKEVNMMVYTDEESISGYDYQVYDLGLAPGFSSDKNNTANKTDYLSQYVSGSLSSSSGKLVYNKTVGADLPIKVPVADLEKNHRYVVKVRAGDKAGNWGEFKEGDGFVVVKSDYSECKKDTGAPDVTLLTDDKGSCTTVRVELRCEDTTGCEIKYGQNPSSTLCEPTLAYNGQKLTFENPGYVCYSVEDNSGNNYTGTKKVNFKDGDGDGTLDSCDKCPNTKPGRIVDYVGCANDEVPESEKSDTDGDGLPDSWEKIHNEFDCEFNYLSVDSNDDGTADALQDYDNDNYNNYEEYRAGTDPCIADALPTPTPTPGGVPPKVTTEEPANVLAWILFLLGLLMVLGGTGYLIYYYKYSSGARKGPGYGGVPRTGAGVGRVSPTRPLIQPGMMEQLKQKLTELKKTKGSREKMKERESVFGEFTKDSKQIPHLDTLLKKKAPHLDKLDELAQKYTEHKEEIKPGLRGEERSIFNKLENISKQTKEKEIEEVMGEKEAKDIFTKLKELSKKRKS